MSSYGAVKVRKIKIRVGVVFAGSKKGTPPEYNGTAAWQNDPPTPTA